jgi:hypothetical protein
MKGPIGREKEYKNMKDSGQLVTDPSTFDFDEAINEAKTEKPKEQFYNLFTHNGCQVKMSAKNGDRYLIEYEVHVKEMEFPITIGSQAEAIVSQKIICYQSLDPHTIGEFIAFPDWDCVQYFNTKTKEIFKRTIR